MWAVHAVPCLNQRLPRRSLRIKRMSIPWRRSCQHFGSALAQGCVVKPISLGWCCCSAPKPRDRLVQRTETDEITIVEDVEKWRPANSRIRRHVRPADEIAPCLMCPASPFGRPSSPGRGLGTSSGSMSGRPS